MTTKTLLQDYDIKIQMLQSELDACSLREYEKIQRIRIKIDCYKSFVVELKRLKNKEKK